MTKKKIFLIAAAVVVVAGGAYAYWAWRASAKTDQPPPVYVKAERGPLRVVVASTGRVVSNLDVDIKCKASGEVVKLPFDVSDSVKKDDLLVELDPINEERVLRQAQVGLSASEAKLQMARQNLDVAERTLKTDRVKGDAALTSAAVRAKDARSKADRLKQLKDKALSSQEEYDTAETAAIQAAADHENAKAHMDELATQEIALELKRQDVKLAETDVESDRIALSIAQDRLRDTKVVAPMDGVVTARNVQTGQIIASGVSNVGGGTAVLTLSDLSHIYVLAAVDESDIGKVQLGQAADITADAYPGRKFKGKVVRIATRGVNASNVVTFEVKIEVEGEHKSLLKPEMTANVEIVVAAKPSALLVPVEAVVRKEGGLFATVVKDDGTTAEAAVTTGLSDGTNTEVLSGLAEGQTVIVHKGSAEGRWNAAGQRPPGGAPPPMMMPRRM